MRSIWKYQFDPGRPTRMALDLPRGAKVVHVDVQGQTPTLWVDLDTEAAREDHRLFGVYATGEEVPERSVYLGTFFVSWTVWHVFEVT